MSDAPTLTTERLVLRPVRRDDAPAVQRYFGDWRIIQNMTTAVPWPYPDDGAEVWLRTYVEPAVAAGRAMLWAITLKEHGDEAIGILEWRIDDSDDADNRGFWIAADFQRRGLMTEAVTAFQDWVFFERGVPRLFVLNAINNPGSRRIKEKTGAQWLGTEELAHHSGEAHAERWLITREAWTEFRR